MSFVASLIRRYAGVVAPALLALAARVVSRRRLAPAALLVWCSRRRLCLVFATWPPRILRVCPLLVSPGGCVGPLVWAHTPQLSQFASVHRLHRTARFIASSYVGSRRSLSCCCVAQVGDLVAPLIRAGVASSPRCSSLPRCVRVSRRLVFAMVVWYCLPPSLHCLSIGCSFGYTRYLPFDIVSSRWPCGVVTRVPSLAAFAASYRCVSSRRHRQRLLLGCFVRGCISVWRPSPILACCVWLMRSQP